MELRGSTLQRTNIKVGVNTHSRAVVGCKGWSGRAGRQAGRVCPRPSHRSSTYHTHSGRARPDTSRRASSPCAWHRRAAVQVGGWVGGGGGVGWTDSPKRRHFRRQPPPSLHCHPQSPSAPPSPPPPPPLPSIQRPRHASWQSTPSTACHSPARTARPC